jgi:8-oxo-dGTP diphosphatase
MKQYRNPTPTVDVILERDSNILMVRRKNDPFKDHLSLPGGFVNEGETVEDAMKREALEETSLEVHPIDILGVYSDPILGGTIRAGDDAASTEWIKVANIKRQHIAFDHAQILRDYQHWKASGGTFWSTKRRND